MFLFYAGLTGPLSKDVAVDDETVDENMAIEIVMIWTDRFCHRPNPKLNL